MVTICGESGPAVADRLTKRLAVAALLLVCSPVAVSAQVAPAQGQNILAGSRIFGAVGCARCHAIDGVGGTVGADLGELERPQTYYTFAAAVWNHLPEMARAMDELEIQRPHLDPWEAADLVAFLTWFDYFERPGNPDVGRAVFREKQCMICHQVAGVGGVAGPSLDMLGEIGSSIHFAATMWNHGPAMDAAMTARGIQRPVFRDSELRDLIAYLKSSGSGIPEGQLFVLPGSPEAGRRLFVDMNCIECHSVRGEGGRIGPDLSRAARFEDLTDFAAAMWNKAPAMIGAMRRSGISIPGLSAAHMADLVAYLTSVSYLGRSGSVELGGRRVRDRGCLGCHSVRGQGAATAGDLASPHVPVDSPAAVIAAVWNHVRVLDSASLAADAEWMTLTASEMADIAAYLKDLGTR